MSSSSLPCTITHTSTSIYTEIHGAFQGVHGSREPGCDKCGVNDTNIDIIIPRAGYVVMMVRCHDQCGARSSLVPGVHGRAERTPGFSRFVHA